MDTEKMFNMQLTIQKLEEEVSLYRNGTTGEDFVEIIKEKESELVATKQALNEKNESLRKLAKTSAGVLAECDRLNETTRQLQSENRDLSEQLSAKNCELESAKKQLAETRETLSEVQDDSICLQKKYEFTLEDVDKLQQRCAVLVKEKTEKGSELDEEKRMRAKDVRELREELDAAMQANTDLKQQLKNLFNEKETLESELSSHKDVIAEASAMMKQQQVEVADAAKKFVESEKSYKNCVAKLEEQLREKCAELESARGMNTTRIEERNRKERDMQAILRQKEDAIAELKQECDTAKRSCEDLIRSSQRTVADREEHWKLENGRLQRLVENAETRLQKLEAEKSRFVSDRREHDLLKAKFASLEDKIKRQEAYMKNRLLKDKSNTLHAPDASYKPMGKTAAAVVVNPGPPTATNGSGNLSNAAAAKSTDTTIAPAASRCTTTGASGVAPIRAGRHVNSTPHTLNGTISSADDSRVKFLSSLAHSHQHQQSQRHRDINISMQL